MGEWKKIIVAPNCKIFEVMKVIDKHQIQFAIVLEDGKLRGTVTDGDIRRGILQGTSLEDCISKVMNENPTAAPVSMPKKDLKKLMLEKRIHQLPLVDQEGNVVDFLREADIDLIVEKHNPVVIMAGGLGTRLGSLTENCPKPLLKVKGKPILEHILNKCISHKLKDFYFSVNFKSEMIEEYFGDGSKWNVNIKYLKENKKLGTAGALSLLNHPGDLPVLVMNGDLLTDINLSELIRFYNKREEDALMCVRNYESQIPYGVIKTNDSLIVTIEEKPVNAYFVNAGIYILDRKVFQFIPKNKAFDMTELFKKLMDEKYRVGVFPIHEYWQDVGQIQDLESARNRFEK